MCCQPFGVSQLFSNQTCSVLAQIDAKIVKPPPERPFEGVITIHLEISPMASSEYEPGRWVCERRARIACCTDVCWDHHVVRPMKKSVSLGCWTKSFEGATSWIRSRCAFWRGRGCIRQCANPSPSQILTDYFSQVWHIRLTVHCLADAGNLLDCACLAGMVALKHFRRPDVEVIGDEVTVVRALPFILHSVLHSNFAFFGSIHRPSAHRSH